MDEWVGVCVCVCVCVCEREAEHVHACMHASRNQVLTVRASFRVCHVARLQRGGENKTNGRQEEQGMGSGHARGKVGGLPR